ncbi:hypothetical protein M0R88_08795 [Halorussus gelatinilyticus]|uniref:Uncharacterized protein n=1 Tax=Halorussus gelatinilyticus TaxID=2937524 RepID=A0A8U0INP6_9EURY|nr:hypothetical protein [Halorussus gelatinilyticus]UPW02176.1 hypothetical protein M0R88_08795 [Halorussus gelatinilyticus]
MTDGGSDSIRDQMEDATSEGVTALQDRTAEFEALLDQSRENRVKQWVLLTGSRSVVAGGLLVVVFLVLIGLGVLDRVNMRQLLINTTTVQTLFSSLLSGAILLVSIVVSINSVVLSQEITSLEEQEERIDASMAYRERIEDVVETDVSPTRPAKFLQIILQSLATQTKRLAEIAADSSNPAFRADVEQFAKQLVRDAKRSATTLDGTQFGSARVLLAGLNYDYSWQLNAARQLQSEYAESLSDEEAAVIGNLIDTLKLFATGQSYFNSLYYKRELARLSNTLLYVSLPVIIITSYVLLALDAKQFPDVSVFGLSPILIVISTAYTIALAPYLVLTVYVVRAGTVTLRTLAAGPFILQKMTGGDEGAWEVSVDTRDWEIPDFTADAEGNIHGPSNDD